ncbi:MAG: DUF6596 domain-containing protein [Pseudomonadota bacterium]
MSTDPRAAAEAAAKDSRARLLGLLSRRTGDLTAAEDALSDAFAAALQTWPRTGVPQSPDAWLLTAAKRRHVDEVRKRSSASAGEPELIRILTELSEASAVDDPRLGLLFVCTHPAIDEAIRAPLMLQVVLGAPTSTIAPCWLMTEAAMAQRLVRAKKKIKDAGIPFEKPGEEVWHERLTAVLDAIYAALTIGDQTHGLLDEALYLASLVHRAVPRSAEAKGLVALALQQRALHPDGRPATFLPLKDRNPDDWNNALIERAEGLLRQAAGQRQPGRYQLEAAIGSAHIIGQRDGRDTRAAVIELYRRLLALSPSIGGRCGYAAALLDAGQPKIALAELRSIESAAQAYQPYWATLASIHRALGADAEAAEALERAIALTTDPSVQLFLISIRDQSTKN